MPQTVQDMEYAWEPATGNMIQRKDKIINFTENFAYDPMLHQRLISWTVNNTTKYEVGYANNGNIETKTQFIEN
jgi:hypothetical protein